MPQVKNLGMPMAGPVPAMPPSPAGLPQTMPGRTAVTQAEPDPDDLTMIFNSYTSGQIDRNSLIEQLRNISTGRGGILALLETMEGKTQPEAAGDFAPIPTAAPPAGPLPGSPPALVLPEAQPELDARHQRISELLQTYGLQPLDADQLSTELNPNVPGGVGHGTVIDSEARVKALKERKESRTPAQVAEQEEFSTRIREESVQTAMPSRAAIKQQAGGGVMVPSAAQIKAEAQKARDDIIANEAFLRSRGYAADIEAEPKKRGYKAGLMSPLPQVPDRDPTGEPAMDMTPAQMARAESAAAPTPTDTARVPIPRVREVVEPTDVLPGRPSRLDFFRPLAMIAGPTYDPTQDDPGMVSPGEVSSLKERRKASEAGNFEASEEFQGRENENVGLWTSLIRPENYDTFIDYWAAFVIELRKDAEAQAKDLKYKVDSDDYNDYVDSIVGASAQTALLAEGEANKKVPGRAQFKALRETGKKEYKTELGRDSVWTSLKEVQAVIDSESAFNKIFTAAWDETTGTWKGNFNADSAMADYEQYLIEADLLTLEGNIKTDSREDEQNFIAGQASIAQAARRSLESATNALAAGRIEDANRHFRVAHDLNLMRFDLDKRAVDIDQARLDQSAEALWGYVRVMVDDPSVPGGLKEEIKKIIEREQLDLSNLIYQTSVSQWQQTFDAEHIGEVWFQPVNKDGEPEGDKIRINTSGRVANFLAAGYQAGFVYALDNQGQRIKETYPEGHENEGDVVTKNGVPQYVKSPNIAMMGLQHEISQADRKFNFELMMQGYEEVPDGKGGTKFQRIGGPVTAAVISPERTSLLEGINKVIAGVSKDNPALAATPYTSGIKNLVTTWLRTEGTPEDFNIPIFDLQGQPLFDEDGKPKFRQGSPEEAVNQLVNKIYQQQGSSLEPFTDTMLSRIFPEPEVTAAEVPPGAPFDIEFQYKQMQELARQEQARTKEAARQFNEKMELDRQMFQLKQMELSNAGERLQVERQLMMIQAQLATSTVLTNAEKLEIDREAQELQELVAKTSREMMVAELTGMLADEPTIAKQQFALSNMLAKATATGAITIDGVTQDTIELRRFMWEQDIADQKIQLETDRLDQEFQIANQQTVLAENRFALDAAIQSGELQNAIEIRKNNMLVQQQQALLERDKLRTETLLALANPGLMLFAQRYGLLNQLGFAMGIDFGDIPDPAPMLEEGAFPTAQQLRGKSLEQRQIMLAEAAVSGNIPIEDVLGTVAAGIPGYQEVPTLQRPTIISEEAR